MSNYNVQFPKHNIVVICEAPDALAAADHVARQEFVAVHLLWFRGQTAMFEAMGNDGNFHKVEATVLQCGDPR